MSYTIVIDERERMKHAANVTNMLRRNCRIGKVWEKTGIKWADRGLPDIMTSQPVIPGPFTNIFPWWQRPGPWSNQAS